jgi:hypothetical protein
VQAYVLEVENTVLGCQSSSEAFRVTLSVNFKQYNIVQGGKGAIVTSISMDDLAETSIRNALAAVKDKLVSGRKKLLFLQLPGPDEIA